MNAAASPAATVSGRTGPGLRFRLIVHPRMEGRLDMAVDEALAEAVGNGESPPVVRLYGFFPPTLSLGRFQRIKGRYAAELLEADGVTLVRRPTGGHAVLHDNELTYSVALSRRTAAPEGGTRKREVYEFIAGMLIAGLARLGVQGTVNASRQGDLHNPDCFASAGEYEIAGRAGRKLIGSAQMATRLAVLQHGSIPLENPGKRVLRYIRTDAPVDTREPTCLNEETGRILTFEEVRDAFAHAFRDRLDVEDSELLPREQRAAERILAEKYGSDAWNLAR